MTAVGSIITWDYWLNAWPDHPIGVTRANAADAYPRALTPLSQDMIVLHEEAATRRFYSQTLGVLSAEDNPDPYMVAYYGLVFLNVDNLAKLGEVTPGSSRQAFLEQFFGLERDKAFRPPRKPWRARSAEAVTGVKVLPRMLKLLGGIRERIDDQIKRLPEARPSGWPVADDIAMDDLAGWFERLRSITVDYWETLILATGLASGVFEATRQVLHRVAGDETGDLNNRLHLGVGGSESSSMARAVGTLANLARQDEDLRAALEDGDRSPALRNGSGAFSAAFADVVERFGHHAPRELELATASWRRHPGQLLDLVATDLGRTGVSNQADQLRADAEATLRRRLPALTARPVFALLRRSRQMVGIREDSKSPAVRLFDEVRRILELAAPRLVESGQIPDIDTIHYLRETELADMLAGRAGPSETELERRREEHHRCLQLRVPELLTAGPDGLWPADASFFEREGMLAPREPGGPGDVIEGIGASPGVVTARATVLDEPWDEFEPGDILVTTATDPGWASVLACASGIVLDIGGRLSHGAIVARELGIPCVVNVKTGSEQVKSGSTITVDGSAGTVRLSGDADIQ